MIDIAKAKAPTTASSQGLPQSEILALIEKTAFARQFGVQLDEYGNGVAVLSIPITPEITQHHKLVHGAVIGFVADSACAWAAASVLGDVVTSEYKLNLLTPAMGSRLIGRGEAYRAGLRSFVCRAEVFVETKARKRLVALAQATVAGLQTAKPITASD